MLELTVDARIGSSAGVATSSTTLGVVDSITVAFTGVKGPTGLSREPNLPDCNAGDFFDGTVLLRARAPDGVDGTAGLAGLGALFECRDRREDVDLFRRIWPSFATLSAAALAFDDDRVTPDFRLGPGVVGVLTTGVPPFCTSCTVFSSAAVPCIPMRK